MVAAEPEYRQRHLVLFRVDARNGKRVAAASPLARHAGVRTDMPLNEANALLRRAAGKPVGSSQSSNHQRTVPGGATDDQFYVFEHDPTADLAALRQFVETLEKFSPVIGIEQDLRQIDGRKKTKTNTRFQPSSILLEVTGLSELFGGYPALATAVLQHCQQLGYCARIAIANTIGLAWGVAHFSSDCRFDSPAVIPIEQTQITAHLPVSGLRIDATTGQTLSRLGITTVGQLLAIDRADLRSRLGDDLIRRLDQLTGKTQEAVIVSRKLPEFTANDALQYPTNHHKTIEVIVERLVIQLCTELKSRQLGSLVWKVRLLSEQRAASVDLRVSLFQATSTAEHVVPLVSMQLEQALQNSKRHELNVHEVIVEVSSCVLLVQKQRQLFDENPRLDRQALSHLINRLSSRLGAENVVYPTFRSGAQPELSFQFRPLVDPQRTGRGTKTIPTSHVRGRPLRLLSPPVPVAVRREAIKDRATAFRKPAQITFHSGVNRSAQSIVRSWGPERIETGWWRGATVQRDYWSIVTQTGTQFWVFCDLKQNKWFIHGEF